MDMVLHHLLKLLFATAKSFFDVTLVSDDEQHIQAHKIILSASSDFFKNILMKSNH